MDSLLTILLCLILVVLSYATLTYSKIDKHKMRAVVYSKKMREILELWVELVVEQTLELGSDTEEKVIIKARVDDYYKNRKKRHPLTIISLTNSIVLILESMSKDNRGYKLVNIPGEAKGDFINADILRGAYNECVEEFNKQLKKTFSLYICKVFRIKKIEELRDFYNASGLDD